MFESRLNPLSSSVGLLYLHFLPSSSSPLSVQEPSSSAGLQAWSSSFWTSSAPNATSCPTRSSSCSSPSSTQLWTPSSTPTVTRRWAPPSGRSFAAIDRRTSTGRSPKDPTDRRRPSTIRCWAEAPCTTITTTITTTNTRWYKGGMRVVEMSPGPWSLWTERGWTVVCEGPERWTASVKWT